MRFALASAGFVLALGVSCAFAEDAEKAASQRRTVFEAWGDEWFLQEGKGHMPSVYTHLQSKRCAACDGKDWIVVSEQYCPLSTSVALSRTTLHAADEASLALRTSVDATFDDPWSDSFRLTFTEDSVRSEVEAYMGPDDGLQREFREEHTWKQKCDARLWHPRTIFKTVELMALDGTEKLSLPILFGREVKTVALVFVEVAEIEHNGRTEKTRCYEARIEGDTEAPRFWVSVELGLLQFNFGKSGPVRRVNSELAIRELALLTQKAEKERRKMMEEHDDPKPTVSRKEIRVVMVLKGKGPEVRTTVNGREAADAAALEALLVEDAEAGRKAGEECVVVVDASSEVPWKRVIEVMDVCKKNGIAKVELATPFPPKK